MMDKKRIAQLLEALGKGLFEKEHVLSLSLLAAVAGERSEEHTSELQSLV
mgnify:CR=1 FL=1